MALKIRRAAVLGAGVMGAQIAAHLAAAGIRTHLLDLASDTPPSDPKLSKALGKNFRSQRAIMGIEALKTLKPAPLVSESILPNIIPGNFTDDMAVLADVDWVIEVVAERMDIKKKIIKQIAETARPGIPVTTNTSGLSLARMCEEQDEFFQKRFFGTHFFNPPRYMKLVEIVPHAGVDRELVGELASWISSRLGKGIVYTEDTVNFIANRIGVFNIQTTFKHMNELGLSIETVDALTGKLMGRPQSATFRTMDVVGLDTFAHVARNVYDDAPDDPYRDVFLPPDWLGGLIERGALGQKSGGVGCYKKERGADGSTEILAFRPKSGQYEPLKPKDYPWLKDALKEPDTFKRLALVFQQKDEGADFVWRVLRDTMSYAALLIDKIAGDDPLSVDDAIRWGFNWQWGPFQLWQGLGYDAILERMKKEGTKLPAWAKPGLAFYKPSPTAVAWHVTGPTEILHPASGLKGKRPKPAHLYYLPKFENKDDPRVVASNRSASLVDIGDGVATLTFHSKMNALNAELIELMQRAVGLVQKDFDALLIANEGDAFSAGADLREVMALIDKKDWPGIDRLLRNFQGTMQMIKYAPFPTVACPHGMRLGGGCEVSLHATRQLLAGDTFAGLVEVGVGLLPAGGGTKELALRAYDYVNFAERGDPMAFLQKAFLLIGMGRVSTSGLEAIEMGLYPTSAAMLLSAEHLVHRAKGLVLEIVSRGYAPPIPRTKIKVVGDPGIQTFKMMLYNMVEGRQISPYDALVGEKIATVLCGGAIHGGFEVSEQYLLDLERRGFIELCQEEKTRARIEHMLKTGKPLRN